MADNQTEEKAKIRIGYIFLAFVPFAVLMAIQTIVQLPGVILSVMDMSKNGQPFTTDLLMSTFNEKYGLISYTVYALAAIAVFLPWYYRSVVKNGPKIIYKKALGVRPVLLSAAVMVCMYFVVTALLTMMNNIAPGAMESYKKLVETSALGVDMAITIVYTILLAPIAEELCFRGVMQGMLEKSNLPVRNVILIQSILFGVMHMNLVQGLYAVILGMILGYLRYKYKTIILNAGVHMFFNFVGTIVAGWLEKFNIPDHMSMIFGCIGLALAAAILVLIGKDRTLYCEKREEQKVIS